MLDSPPRRFPRIPAQHVVLVRSQGERPLEEFARTRTLGLGGCMFVSEEPLGNGRPLELAIAVAGRVVRTGSRVVYERERGSFKHEVGVEFLGLSPADRNFLAAVVAERLEA